MPGEAARRPRRQRGLSDLLLEMVEEDSRFIELTASQTLAWLKIIRRLDRNTKRGTGTGWEEVRLLLHVSSDRLHTLFDIYQGLGLLTYARDGWRVPDNLYAVMASKPHRTGADRQLS